MDPLKVRFKSPIAQIHDDGNVPWRTLTNFKGIPTADGNTIA
jgi:hypothetical protein